MELDQGFVESVERELVGNILPFWMNEMTDPRGGFYGRMDGHGILHADAEKGGVLNARILWAFSAAYRVLKKQEYLMTATRAKDYLLDYFLDKKYGGIYWTLDCEGKPSDTKKQFYALGFAIYGLSEYVRATGDRQALQQAISLYEVIEKYSFDREMNGYVEAKSRNWQYLEDVRLSDKDANERKTMNTHLHILEPYVNLYRVWPDVNLRESIINLLNLFMDKIYDPKTGHLGLFFDDEWNRRDAGCSYGHDIEASWLLLEAAQVLGDPEVLERIKPITYKIAKAGWEGLRGDGSMIYEKHADGSLDEDRHWWVQAETVVGSLWMAKYFKDPDGIGVAENCWNYILTHLCDEEKGEWFWSVHGDGTVNEKEDKAGLWKCPYHNTRMCLEVIGMQGNGDR